jgi:hypothetical protein
MEKIHLEDLRSHVKVVVGCDAVGPVIGKTLADEEGDHGLQVWAVAVGAGGKEFVEEGGGAEKEEGEWAEVEVGVLSAGLVVALFAVEGEAGGGEGLVEIRWDEN